MSFARAPQKGLPIPLLFSLALAVVAAAGCNRQTCAGLNAPSKSPYAPKLVEVEILNQDVLNPWQFNLALKFEDLDGDLGPGELDIYVGASEPIVLPLATAFATSNVASNATAGRLGIDVNLSSSSVQDDSSLRLGFQLRDAAGYYGNCYSLDLHFDVDRLGFVVPRAPSPVPCSTRLAAVMRR